MEYEFKVFYRRGAKNTIADAVSRLPTWGYTNVDPDLDIPCFGVFSVTTPELLRTDEKSTVPTGNSKTET